MGSLVHHAGTAQMQLLPLHDAIALFASPAVGLARIVGLTTVAYQKADFLLHRLLHRLLQQHPHQFLHSLLQPRYHLC